jgi:hypothetical protein
MFDSGGKLHPLQRMTINLFISMPLRLKARRLIVAFSFYCGDRAQSKTVCE